MKTPKFVYHVTHKDHVASILKDSALKSPFNLIFVCPTKRDLISFFPTLIKSDFSDYVLFRISTRNTVPKLWSVSYDHNRKRIPADAFIYSSPELPLGRNFTVEHLTTFEEFCAPYFN